MHAVLLGKVRRKGTSKSGKPYDFTVCSVSYSSFSVEGMQVAEVIVDARMIQYDALKIDANYDFDYDNNGNLLNVFIED